ncbi:unnamed protein product, partial [Sphagnum jensenii]
MGAPGADRPPRGPPREGERPPWFGDREGYRSSSGFGGEKGGVPGDYLQISSLEEDVGLAEEVVDLTAEHLVQSQS